MNLLPDEILEMIMMEVPPNKLSNICCVDNKFAAVGRDRIFKLRYSDRWLLEIRSYYSPDNGLFLAGLIDSPSLIEYFLNKGGSIEQLTAGASSTKNYRLVNYSIEILQQSLAYPDIYLVNKNKIENILTYYGYLHNDPELLKIISFREISLENQILAYAYNGKIDILLILIQRYQPLKVKFFYTIIEELVKGSYLECIDQLADKYESYGICIYQNAIGFATKYGNIDLVESLLKREKNNLYIPIVEAAFKGDYNLLDFFIETAVTSALKENYISYAFDSVFETILEESKLKLITESETESETEFKKIDSETEFKKIDSDRSKNRSKNRKFIKEKIENKYRMLDYLISIGNINLNAYMLNAIRDDNIPMLKYCISKGANNIPEAFHYGFYRNKLNIIKYLSKIYSNKNLNNILNEGLLIASKYGYMEMMDLLISLGGTNIEQCFNNCAYNGRRSMMNYIMTKFSVDLNNALMYATVGNQKDTIKLLILKGATNLEEASLQAIRLNLFSLLVVFYSHLIDLENFDLLIHLALACKHGRLNMIQHMMIYGGKNKLSIDQIDDLIKISENQEICDYLHHVKLCRKFNV